MEQQPAITVLINPSGGRAQQAGAVDQLRGILRDRLPTAEVELLKSRDDAIARSRAARAAGREIVAAAGGDGTLNSVAQALVGSPAKLGVLPFGTFNHFARDLGIPLDLAAAADLLASTTERRIDVGAVNEHYFLNNASLGLYPNLVELRHRARNVAKPLRLLDALWQLARTARPLPLELHSGNAEARGPIWLVFVGNNAYDLDIFRARHRRRLDTSRLDVVVVRAHRRVELGRLVLHALRGRVHSQRLVRFEPPTLDVRPLDPNICEVAFDGEAVEMAPPFHFRSLPRALSVVAPSR